MPTNKKDPGYLSHSIDSPFYYDWSSEESHNDPPPYAGHELPTSDIPTSDRKVSNVPQTATFSKAKLASDQHTASSFQAETDGVHDFEKATKLFGNPLAKDDQWSVTRSDFKRIRLPKIGIGLTVKNSFRSVTNPAKHDRPGFRRDPHHNIWFDPDMEFRPIRIPNKLRHSRYVGTGFKRVFKGDVFARHDVSAADWQQFLYDITAAGTSAIGTIPLGRNIGNTRLPFIHVAGNIMQMCHESSARKVIDIWQQRFFAPRGLNIRVEGQEWPLYQPGCQNVLRPQNLNYKQQELYSKAYGETRLIVSKLS